MALAKEPVVVTTDRVEEAPFPIISPDGSVLRTVYIGVGDGRGLVLEGCGRPQVAINRNLWVYRNCSSQAKAAKAANCDTLLIAFAQDRVIGLKFVNWEVLQAALPKESKAGR